MRPPVNDNRMQPATSVCVPVGPLLVHAPAVKTHPYRHLAAFPGACVSYGYSSPREAVAGPAAITLSLTGACHS